MSTATYNVLLYPSAESDLYEIKQYFEQVLKTSPKQLFQNFYNAIEYLEKNPFMYPLVKDQYLNQLGWRCTVCSIINSTRNKSKDILNNKIDENQLYNNL